MNQTLRRSATHVLLDAADAAQLDADVIALSDEHEHHLARVLRLRDGDVVSVTDGAGRWRMSVWNGASRSLTVTSPVEYIDQGEPLVLLTAIPKGDRVDVLVQKATELGVGRIVFVHAERSVVRWKPERAAKQLARLARVADEAVRQSRRCGRVSIEGPRPAVEVLADAVVAEPGAAPYTGVEPMVAIGPEGGWTTDETELAAGEVSLGSAILRVETAAVAVCALRMASGHPAL